MVGAREDRVRPATAPAPHTGNVTAWDLVRQSTFNFHKVTQPTHILARRFFREAAELDPVLPEAQIWWARANAGLIDYGWTENPAADGKEGLDASLRAIYLDPRNPYARYARGIASAYARVGLLGFRRIFPG